MSPYTFMCYEMIKAAAAEGGEEVSDEEALQALRRLRKLEATKPKPEELARGAIAGSIVGTGAGLASTALAPGGLRNLTSGFKGTFARGAKGVPVGLAKGMLHAGRAIAAPAAGSAVFGAGLPVARSHLDREAEKQKLRQYLGEDQEGGHLSQARRAITQKLGV